MPVILIIEDEPRLAMAIARMLRPEFSSVWTGDPSVGLKLVDGVAGVDLVLTDLDLCHQLNGMDVVRFCRDQGVKVVLMSGDHQALSAIGQSVRKLPKPFDPGALREALWSAVQG